MAIQCMLKQIGEPSLSSSPTGYCCVEIWPIIFTPFNLYFIVETNAKSTGYFHLVQGSILKEIKPSYPKYIFSLHLFNPFRCLMEIKTRIR